MKIFYFGSVVAVLDSTAQNLEPLATDGVHHRPSVLEILNVSNLQHGSIIRKPENRYLIEYFYFLTNIFNNGLVIKVQGFVDPFY